VCGVGGVGVIKVINDAVRGILTIIPRLRVKATFAALLLLLRILV
jgi:hypothetical protein